MNRINVKITVMFMLRVTLRFRVRFEYGQGFVLIKVQFYADGESVI